MDTPKWVWTRLIYGFLGTAVFSFWWDGLSHEASEKSWEISVFFAIIIMSYTALLPEPGENKIEISNPGEFLAPILFFAGPIMGTIAFFLARFIRHSFF